MSLSQRSTNLISNQPSPVSPGTLAMPYIVSTAHSPFRAEAEQAVVTGFLQYYQARITHFLPVMVTTGIRCQAVLGIESDPAQFYSIRYLSDSLTCRLDSLGLQSAEGQIVELGNLFSRGARYTLALFMGVGLALARLGVSTLVFTATTQLRTLLMQNGLHLHTLAEASTRALTPEQAAAWGSYYTHSPQVVVLALSDVELLLQQQPLLLRHLARYCADISPLIQQLELAL